MNVPVLKGDQLYIKFPDQIRTPLIPKCIPPEASQNSCVRVVTCGTQTGYIVATFDDLQSDCDGTDYANYFYKFYIEDIKNAPNFITSEKFNAYIISNEFQRIAELDKQQKVTVTNTIPGDIQEDNFFISQEDKAFSSYNTYSLTIVPTNTIPRLGWVEVELPSLVSVYDKETVDNLYQGVNTDNADEWVYDSQVTDEFYKYCTIETTKLHNENCYLRVLTRNGKIKRFVTFFNAFLQSEDYSSEFTIKMRLRNPDDNFDRQDVNILDGKKEQIDLADKAFKLRTFTFDLEALSIE